jgi:hypothetical protein
MVIFDIFARPVRADHFSCHGNADSSSDFCLPPAFLNPFTINVAALDVGHIQATYTSLQLTVVNFCFVSTSDALELQV